MAKRVETMNKELEIQQKSRIKQLELAHAELTQQS